MSARVRGACPGLSDPMRTGDGLLARFVPAEPMTPDAFAQVCRAAHLHGNGILEVSARGSLQVRGLRPETTDAFAEAIAAHVRVATGVPVAADPLGDVSPQAAIDSHALAGEMREAIDAAALADRLGPKVCVAIDSGAALHLGGVSADVRLRAKSRDTVQVSVGGDAVTAASLGVVALADAIGVVARLLDVIAADGKSTRARDIVLDRFAAAIGCPPDEPPSASSSVAATEPIGIHTLRDGCVALGIGLPFGHCGADTLERLGQAASRAGAGSIRPAPGRALLLVGVTPAAVESLTTTAARLGFITRADDPRRRVSACAGKPACASGEIAARAMAPAIAAAAAALIGEDATIHVSGCPKGCAHPGKATITIVGVDGKAGLVMDGRADGEPGELTEPERVTARLAATIAVLQKRAARLAPAVLSKNHV